MSSQPSVFVGRLHRNTRQRDLEKIFEYYGTLSRCEIKCGSGMAYAFLDYEDRRDAEDAIKYENGREVLGNNIVVEWARGPGRGRGGGGGGFGGRDFGGGRGYYGGRGGGFRGGGRYGDRRPDPSRDECFKCHRTGHWARDCPEDRGGRSSSGRGRRSRSRSSERSPSRSRSRSG